MNHLAKAFGKEAFRSHRPLFQRVGGKKQHSIHFSCSFMSSARFFPRTHSVLKVIHSSFLLAGLRKANIWRV